jgi:hypothetical protein
MTKHIERLISLGDFVSSEETAAPSTYSILEQCVLETIEELDSISYELISVRKNGIVRDHLDLVVFEAQHRIAKLITRLNDTVTECNYVQGGME